MSFGGLDQAMLDRTYRGARVLVTGHTGFKGSWLVMWLRDLGAEVTGLALAPPTTPSLFEAANVASLCRHEIGDVRDAPRVEAIVRDVRPDVIFHLAAQSIVRRSYEAPVDTFGTNVMGTVNLLEAVRRVGKPTHVVVVTSDKCYENHEWAHGYRESDALGGHDPYSTSKAAAELVVASYRRSYFDPTRFANHEVALASARAGNAFGGGDWAKDRLVPDLVSALAAHRVAVVRNADSVRAWQHVLEPLGGYLLLGCALRAEPQRYSDAYNFGPSASSTRTVREIVEGFVAAWGEGSWQMLAEADAPHEARVLRLAIDKATTELGYLPRWTVDTAIAATVDWYRAHARGASPKDLHAESLAQIRAYAGGG